MVDEGVALLQTRARQLHADLLVPVASSSAFVHDVGHMCGACGDGNNLHIGIGGRYFDEVSRAKAVDVCGPVCERHDECGGFNFVESLHRCYYRRVTTCQHMENATHDCYTKTADNSEGRGQVHELAAMRNYILDQGRTCGACGAENNMALGLDNKLFDAAKRETAIEICGAKCSQHKECGGFNFVESLGNCYYRKLTSCQASQDVDRDCYTKMSEAHDNDGFVDEPQAALVLENKALEKTLRKRSAALKDTKARLSQLQLELEAKDQIRDGKASEAHNVDQAAEFLSNSTLEGGADLDGVGAFPEMVVEQDSQTASSMLGATAGLDQDGYSAVVALDNSSVTKEFVRRVVADVGCEVTDEGGLEGLIQFYNKTSEQTYEGLRSELLSASALPSSWLTTVVRGEEGELELDGKVPTGGSKSDELPLLQDKATHKVVDGDNVTAISGRSAALDEEGYTVVVSLWDDAEMEKFVERTVSQLGCKVTDRGRLHGFIPFYSKENARSFHTMKSELQKISKAPGSWIVTALAAADSSLTAQNSTTHQTEKNMTRPEEKSAMAAQNLTTPQTETNNTGPEESMMESESETDYHYHAGDLLAATANVTKMLWQIPTIWDPRSTLQRFNSFTITGGPTGETAALSPKGYREVDLLNNVTEMAVFARRIADDFDYEITSEDGLVDFISLNNMTELNYTSLSATIVAETKVEGSWVAKRDHGPTKTEMMIGALHEISRKLQE